MNINSERRENLRMPVPERYLKECAIWFGKELSYQRLFLADLGKPTIVLGNDNRHSLGISDISIKGMRLSLTLPPESGVTPTSSRGMFIYFKLLHPSEFSDDHTLCLFLCAEIMRMQRDKDVVTLGLRFTQKIVPERYERAFTFFTIEKYGISDLARWCDALSRESQQDADGQRPRVAGIDLDDLLEELQKEESSCSPS